MLYNFIYSVYYFDYQAESNAICSLIYLFYLLHAVRRQFVLAGNCLYSIKLPAFFVPWCKVICKVIFFLPRIVIIEGTISIAPSQ